MSARLSAIIVRRWRLVILCWVVVLVVLRWTTPSWDSVTQDGDFAFLPAEMPSVIGEKLTESAFPTFQAKSQIVLILARPEQPLTELDLQVGDELAARMLNFLGVARFAAAEQQLDSEPLLAAEESETASARLAAAEAALSEAIQMDPKSAIANHNRAVVRRRLGFVADSDRDRAKANQLAPPLRLTGDQIIPAFAAELPISDVWTRDNEVFGSKLISPSQQALLIILQLRNEFMEAGNIGVMSAIQAEVAKARAAAEALGAGDLTIAVSGSAAVGADLQAAAIESIQNTEAFTIGLVILILAFVYRAPLVVLVPLLTIGVSLGVAMSVLAAATQVDEMLGWQRGLNLFKTTRIFVVVILFGAGTDFCLFLIARYREQLADGTTAEQALPAALQGVGSALVASAMTTIVGLGMMFFADFGKFRSSGPAIALCLAIALIACLTLAPALLRAMGPLVFWPFQPSAPPAAKGNRGQIQSISSGLWNQLARLIVARPATTLLGSLLLLAPWALAGVSADSFVSFDLLNELPADRPSRSGGRLLSEHFSIGESAPIIVLAKKSDAAFGSDGEAGTRSLTAIQQLTAELAEIEGVTSVRSLAEPLGDPPQRLSILSAAGRRKLFLREHRLTESIFVAQAPEMLGEVTRFELLLDVMPFSSAALGALDRVEKSLHRVASEPGSFWFQTEFAYTGATAGIRDLKVVTRSDQRRIQLLVVLAVFIVLWCVLRRFVICLYLIASVVFSYLVTIGATGVFFQWLYGDTFHGLDWKVPVFLFVILVAVGEDYNIYLVTRIFEEQAKWGPFAGLRRALVKTGGIITSCGLIMAGTFVSMTSGSLRGIVELGFALSLGVLLDTFVVRSILVPAFIALYCRWKAAPLAGGTPQPPGNLELSD